MLYEFATFKISRLSVASGCFKPYLLDGWFDIASDKYLR